MLEWLQMDGFWAFVWPAYGIVALGLAAILVSALRTHSRAMKALESQERASKG